MKGVRVHCVTSLYSSISLSPSSAYDAGNVSRLNLLFCYHRPEQRFCYKQLVRYKQSSYSGTQYA